MASADDLKDKADGWWRRQSESTRFALRGVAGFVALLVIVSAGYYWFG